VIDRQIAIAASLIKETFDLGGPDSLQALVPMLARGLALTQREMLAWLLDNESDWPWNE
jgi:hypothetical protein